MNKPQRWYEVEGETAYVYDAPYSRRAHSVSIVKVADLKYYRSAFRLTKVWGQTPPVDYIANEIRS